MSEMKINKMTNYAIRVIVRLYAEGEELITTKTLSEKENISQGVLMKVLFPLKKAGIVRSHQGRGNISGGFQLARSIKDITIYDVIRTMEGEICFSKGIEDGHSYQETNKVIQEIQRVNDVLVQECGRYSIYDILNAKSCPQ